MISATMDELNVRHAAGEVVIIPYSRAAAMAFAIGSLASTVAGAAE